jgi:hypothetical protein
MRGTELIPDVISLHTVISKDVNSKEKYVSICNDLRNELCSKIPPGFRWNGAERESVLNSHVFERSGYICGKYCDYMHIRLDGSYSRETPMPGNDLRIMSAYERATQMSDPGQSKLFSLMYGFAQSRDIIYVGAAPGDGWQHALRMLNSNINVIAIDPADLSAIYSKTVHIKEKLTLENAERVLLSLPVKGYDFIWDVRSDTSSLNKDAAYEAIRNEIAIYNFILTEVSLMMNIKRWNIKVNVASLREYIFPENASLFVLPFSVSRPKPINEMRSVFFLNGKLRNAMQTSESVCREISALFSMVKREKAKYEYASKDDSFADVRLFLNCLFMRFDTYDFIDVIPDNSMDVALFCLNWNSPERIAAYLDELKRRKIPIIGSYFSDCKLEEGEFSFNEEILIMRAMKIFDSRSIVRRKLFGLYLFCSGLDISFYLNEMHSSETFVIKYVENLYNLESNLNYDEIRDAICAKENHKFLKFPVELSLSDRIVSPSGHMARMVYYDSKHPISVGMFFYKVVCNFFVNGRKSTVHPKWLANDDISKKYDLDRSTVGNAEYAPKNIWHSIEEWSLGLKSGIQMSRSKRNEFFIPLLEEVCINKTYSGIEVYTFYKKNKYDLSVRNKKLDESYQYYKVAKDMTDIDLLELVREKLKKIDSFSWENFFSSNATRNALWWICVERFRLDAVYRDYWIHTSYVIYLCPDYIEHDKSKLSIDELINYRAAGITKDPTFFELHFSGNEHHSQFWTMKDEKSMMPDHALRECCVDLAARRWQFSLKWRQAVFGKELWNVDDFSIRQGIDIVRFKQIMSEVIVDTKAYFLDDVRRICESRMPGLFK